MKKGKISYNRNFFKNYLEDIEEYLKGLEKDYNINGKSNIEQKKGIYKIKPEYKVSNNKIFYDGMEVFEEKNCKIFPEDRLILNIENPNSNRKTEIFFNEIVKDYYTKHIKNLEEDLTIIINKK